MFEFQDGRGPVPAHRHKNPNGEGGWVADTALVSGSAWVSGGARVYGDAWGYSSLYVQGSQDAIVVCARGMVAIGCCNKPLKDWLKNYRAIGKEAGYTPEEIVEYGVLLRAVAAWMKLKKVDKP